MKMPLQKTSLYLWVHLFEFAKSPPDGLLNEKMPVIQKILNEGQRLLDWRRRFPLASIAVDAHQRLAAFPRIF